MRSRRGRRVEGLPLALELAAAWVRVLPCEAIAQRLRGDLELLRAPDASYPARHASVEQVFDDSWRQLSPIDRKALARLSLFQGGFTAEAAHAARFHDTLVRLHPRADSGDGRALDAIDADFENLRRAWQFAVAAQQAEVLSRSIPALASHCEHRARFEEGLALLRGVADAPFARKGGSLQASALGYAALLEYRLARYDDARATATLALDLARRARDREARFQALKVLGSCGTATGRLDEARSLYREALELARALSHGVPQTLENLALVEKRAGHYARSLELSHEALAAYRRDGNSAALAMGLTNLGSICMFMDDTVQAAVHLREALAISEREGLTSTRAFALANLTELALETQDWEGAPPR